MTLAEKIVALKPAVVTAAWISSIAVATIVTEVLFPLGSPFWWLSSLVFAAITLPITLGWPAALNAVALSRQVEAAAAKRASRSAFRGAAMIMLLFVTLGSASVAFFPNQMMFAVMALALLGGYFSLRAFWLTAEALVDFEGSADTFRTFVSVFYFPIGVWFLEPRLQRLLSAPPQTTASIA